MEVLLQFCLKKKEYQVLEGKFVLVEFVQEYHGMNTIVAQCNGPNKFSYIWGQTFSEFVDIFQFRNEQIIML